MSNPPTHIYKFGNYYLNTVERKVLKINRYINISSKAFDILQLLIERHGEIVTKEEIIDQVWKGVFIEEGNLTVNVSKIRKLLNDDTFEQYIETVFGVGYRFVSKIEMFDQDDWNAIISNSDNSLMTPKNEPAQINSIAVLPLENKNGNDEIDYLADGITESLINKLSNISSLKVIARNTVFQYKDMDFRKVGNELKVQKIITGRIRIIRENLVIAVELIETKDGTQIWGTQMNKPFEDIFEIQKVITRTISEKLIKHMSTQ